MYITTNEELPATGFTTEVLRLLQVVKGDMRKRALKEMLHLQNDEHVRKAYISPATKLGLIEMSIPDKPRSSNQKYRITSLGKEILEKDTH